MQTIMIISLSCFGWKLATSKGNVLFWLHWLTSQAFRIVIFTLIYMPLEIVNNVFNKKIDTDSLCINVHEYLLKPLFTCIYCMASTSTLLFFISNDLELFQVDTAWMMLAVCGLNVVLSALVELALSMKEFVKIN